MAYLIIYFYITCQRVPYVAGFIWGNSLVKAPDLPSFENYAFLKLEFRCVKITYYATKNAIYLNKLSYLWNELWLANDYILQLILLLNSNQFWSTISVQPRNTSISIISANMAELAFFGCKSNTAKCHKAPCNCASADPPQCGTTLCACRQIRFTGQWQIILCDWVLFIHFRALVFNTYHILLLLDIIHILVWKCFLNVFLM